MVAAIDTAFLQRVKETIQTIDPTAEVWLFGSRARGDAREDSDWDFLILTDHLVDQSYKRSLRDKLFYLGLDSGSIISTTIKNKMAWKQLALTNFFRCIEEDAITL